MMQPGFGASLPRNAGPERENAILNAIERGDMAPVSWAPVRNEAAGHKITLLVSSDALRIRTADGPLRVSVTARTMQRIADMLGCVLPTVRICDLIWEQAAVKITPCIYPANDLMATTARMIEYDAAVSQKVAGRSGLVENVGKNWCISNRLLGQEGMAANYGFYASEPRYRSGTNGLGPYHLWQPLGTRHSMDYVDYSQTIRLVSRTCYVDGEKRDLVDILTDPTLAALVSDDGPLKLVRLPGVEVTDPIDRYPVADVDAVV
ncbi:hypothetical protein [Polyangium sp. y55x31]|uniref:hypothetical protein n=1 Tax=Polyangium sp. y55x31 TaxID=3042688 RepID=UPI002482F9E1|nr:hypothetical protein [Polyangium sp. y55x31]MDI1477591.1 hypothetical protein [Polyangium sp. y55x31]